jgi:hypothetical protein
MTITPGRDSQTSPLGRFVLKDVMLLGATHYTAAEALEASS